LTKCYDCFGLRSQSQSLSVTVSSDSVLLGNYIKLEFKVENIDGQFEAPDLSTLEIISGPNTSSSIQIINGDKSSHTTYSYFVKPMELGTHIIAPAYLVAEEQTFETSPIEINIYPNPENLIMEPESQDNDSFFDLQDWGSFRSVPQAPKTPTTPTKPKRKYKKI